MPVDWNCESGGDEAEMGGAAGLAMVERCVVMVRKEDGRWTVELLSSIERQPTLDPEWCAHGPVFAIGGIRTVMVWGVYLRK